MIKRVKELSLERAKALLGKKKISEERLKRVLERIKAFCKVAYQLYANTTDDPNKPCRKLDAEPPDEFTNAA